MSDRSVRNEELLQEAAGEEEKTGAAAALFDERAQSDQRLGKERDVVDHAFNELEHDTRVARSTRAFLRRLHERISSLRQASEVEKGSNRQDTDEALANDSGERLDARQGFSAILAELDVIGNAIISIREAPPGQLGEADIVNLAGTVEVAANRILEVVENLQDPEDDRGLYHETGSSG